MRNKIVFLLIIFITNIITCLKRTESNYKDGIYTGESQSVYTDESYYGITTITIKNDAISAVDFKVFDKARNEVFDEKYEKHFKDIPAYVQQCRNDWKGIQAYPKIFMLVQNINKVDAITGATWSYNLFKASLLVALENAKQN